jgi:hypothetical protein
MTETNPAQSVDVGGQPPASSPEKDPEDWVTGDEPMTGAQASYLGTLAQDTGREVPGSLTKSEASKLIDELREESPRTGS